MIFDFEGFKQYFLKLKLLGEVDFNLLDKSIMLKSNDNEFIVISHDEFVQVRMTPIGSLYHVRVDTSKDLVVRVGKGYSLLSIRPFNRGYLLSRPFSISGLSFPITYVKYKFNFNGKVYDCSTIEDTYIQALSTNSHQFAINIVTKENNEIYLKINIYDNGFYNIRLLNDDNYTIRSYEDE